MRTVSYTDLKNRFTSAIGVDSLLTAEETAFKRSLNDRVRGAWTRAKWPELSVVLEKTVAAVGTTYDRALQVDVLADLFDIFSVWSKNPFTDRTGHQINYTLINGYMVLPAATSETTVYVVGSQVPATDYGDGTTTLPAFLERVLLAATMADWYRADSQNSKALAEEERAELYLLEELDRIERLQRQDRGILVTPYPASWPTLLVTQTTI